MAEQTTTVAGESESERKKKRLLDYLSNPDAAAMPDTGVTSSNRKLSDYDPRTGLPSATRTIYPNLPFGGAFMSEGDIFSASPVGRTLSQIMEREKISGVDPSRIAMTSGDYRRGLASILSGMMGNAAPRGRGRTLLGTMPTEEDGGLFKWPGNISI